MIAFCAVLYNISLLFMSRYSVSTWYISRTIEVVSKLTVMVIFMCHIFSALRVTKNIAHRDPLTNIFNRNYFFNELTVQSASAQKTPYCVMIMDIDHFKKVNDTWGHPVGDQVIKTVVNIIGKSIRPDDLLARVGGEEFGVLLTDIDTERAKALAERIRENVERLTGDNPEYAIPQKVTISIGAVVTQENALNNSKDMDALMATPLWQAMPFVRAGRFQRVPAVWFYGATLSAMHFVRVLDNAIGGKA